MVINNRLLLCLIFISVFPVCERSKAKSLQRINLPRLAQYQTVNKKDSPIAQNIGVKGESLKKLTASIPQQRRLFADIPAGDGHIHYLGQKYTQRLYLQVKQQELDRFKKQLKVKFKIDFKVKHTRYFNMAYLCSEAMIQYLIQYLVEFFNQIYPRFFIYEPLHVFSVVYFTDYQQYHQKTGSAAYGHYMSDEKTLYTYTNSGYGTLWHEMIHAFVDENVEGNPQEWFNEGFASFYEMGYLLNNKILDGYTNWRLPMLKQVILSNQLTPIKTFLRARRMQESYAYAAARFLFCYLWAQNKMTEFVKAYLFELCPKYSGKLLGEMAILKMEQLTGKKIEAIEKEYIQLAKQAQPYQKLVQKK